MFLATTQIMLAASGLENLLAVVIFVVISILAQWAKKKSQKRQGDWAGEEAPPRTPEEAEPPASAAERPPRIPQATSASSLDSWEEQIRRLLEGEEEERGPAPRPPGLPPPIVAPSDRAAKPPPLPLPPARPTPVIYPQPVTSTQGSALEDWQGLGEVRQLEPHVTDRPAHLKAHGGAVDEAAAVRAKAEELQALAATHLHRAATHQASAVKSSSRARISPEISHVLSLLRRPQTAREVVIASAILGPPKGLE